MVCQIRMIYVKQFNNKQIYVRIIEYVVLYTWTEYGIEVAMRTIASRVEKYVKHVNRGTVFTFSHLLMSLGEAKPDTVSHALKKLINNNEIARIRRGVYLRPEISRFGVIPVSVDKVMTATAQSIGAEAFPSGMHALHALGLSEQLAMGQSYLTTRRIEPFSVGNTHVSIQYSRALERVTQGLNSLNEAERRKIILLWISLDYLGERETSLLSDEINKIIETLSPSARERLRMKCAGRLSWARLMFAL